VDTRTANREASQVGLGVVKERIGALARFYAELGIEPPSKIEAKPQAIASLFPRGVLQ
jgi:hypothetical protein